MFTTVAEANSAIGRHPASRRPFSENSNPMETKAKIRNQVRRSLTVAIEAFPPLAHCRYSVPMIDAATKPSTVIRPVHSSVRAKASGIIVSATIARIAPAATAVITATVAAEPPPSSSAPRAPATPLARAMPPQTPNTYAADRPPHHLSFGQRRRVAVATVLSMQPEVLVLDEPSSNLDPAGRRELAEVLEALPITLLMVTHDLPYALQLCPRSVVLDGGVVVADAPTRELLADPARLAAHRLELPFGFDPSRV